MSLQTDMVFFRAMKESRELSEMVGEQIFNTAIPGTDSDVDNVEVPYIVVKYDGMNNEDATKDDPYEGDTDIVNIGVEIAARSREGLADIADAVRRAVSSFCQNYDYEEDDDGIADEIPEGFTLSAQAVQYDPWKPCFWQVLSWRCETKRIEYNEQD